MKDIPGIPRPQIVEEFISSLREGMTSGNRSVVELPQVRVFVKLSCAFFAT